MYSKKTACTKQRNWSREVYDNTKVRKPKTEYWTYIMQIQMALINNARGELLKMPA